MRIIIVREIGQDVFGLQRTVFVCCVELVENTELDVEHEIKNIYGPDFIYDVVELQEI